MGLYRAYMGIMEKNMEATMTGYIGFGTALDGYP